MADQPSWESRNRCNVGVGQNTELKGGGNVDGRWVRPSRGEGGEACIGGSQKAFRTPRSLFLPGSCCSRGELCSFLHACSATRDMNFLSKLTGRDKAVRAKALSVETDKLYSAREDQTIRVWDCSTGKCSHVASMGADIGCLLSESSWLFAALPNAIKAWNLQTNVEQSLAGPSGQVLALAVCSDILIAGAEDGHIFSWKFTSSTSMFQATVSFCGHTGVVVTLEAESGRLFSASEDKSIGGVLSLCGYMDQQGKAIFVCSYNDNEHTMHLFELPLLTERGVLSMEKVQLLHVGLNGLLFSGDKNGGINVWKWAPLLPAVD